MAGGVIDPNNPVFGNSGIPADYRYLAQLERMRRGTQQRPRVPRQIQSQDPAPSRIPIPTSAPSGVSSGSYLTAPRSIGPEQVSPSFGSVSPNGSRGPGGPRGTAGGGGIFPDWSYLDQLDEMRNKPMSSAQNVTDEEGSIPMFGRSLADYLSGISEESLISEQLAALDEKEQALRGQAGSGDAQLAKIYQWLVNQIGGQDAQINQQYQQAQEQTRGNMTAATQAVTEGGKATDSQLAEAFGNLGIERSAGSGNLAAGRAGQIGDMAQRGQANADYLANSGVTQRNLNRSNRTAAGFRGAEERSSMQRQLAEYLAGLQTERSNVRAQGRSMAADLAKAQYDADLANFRDERDFSADRDDQAWDRSIESSRLKLAQQEATRGSQTANKPAPFDQIGQRLLQTQGRRNADAILGVLAEQARLNTNANTTPGNFARRVHDAVAKLGLSPAAALEAHAAAEEYWQAYRD